MRSLAAAARSSAPPAAERLDRLVGAPWRPCSSRPTARSRFRLIALVGVDGGGKTFLLDALGRDRLEAAGTAAPPCLDPLSELPVEAASSPWPAHRPQSQGGAGRRPHRLPRLRRPRLAGLALPCLQVADLVLDSWWRYHRPARPAADPRRPLRLRHAGRPRGRHRARRRPLRPPRPLARQPASRTPTSPLSSIARWPRSAPIVPTSCWTGTSPDAGRSIGAWRPSSACRSSRTTLRPIRCSTGSSGWRPRHDLRLLPQRSPGPGSGRRRGAFPLSAPCARRPPSCRSDWSRPGSRPSGPRPRLSTSRSGPASCASISPSGSGSGASAGRSPTTTCSTFTATTPPGRSWSWRRGAGRVVVSYHNVTGRVLEGLLGRLASADPARDAVARAAGGAARRRDRLRQQPRPARSGTARGGGAVRPRPCRAGGVRRRAVRRDRGRPARARARPSHPGPRADQPSEERAPGLGDPGGARAAPASPSSSPSPGGAKAARS